MSFRVRVATTQMDAAPAAVDVRLARAERLVRVAASRSARLVVLPELFNLGYAYTLENCARAEPQDGRTRAWMQTIAQRYGVHLAGTWLLREGGQIYNAQLLVAPDGRAWRYDKRYPWAWERAYYRPGRGIMVAETDIGRLGMMVCWDTAHRGLWRAYAGRVQAMIVSSCPPNVPRARLVFPRGAPVAVENLGWIGAELRESGERLFGRMLAQQAAWLGVPLIHAGCVGRLHTPVPRPVASLLAYAMAAPALLRYLPRAGQAVLEGGFVADSRIVGARGETLVSLTADHGEAVAVAEVEIPTRPPMPDAPQPRCPLPRMAYVVSDGVLPMLMGKVCRRFKG